MKKQEVAPPSVASVTASASSASSVGQIVDAAMAQIELPFDTNDIRYDMLNDYEKCLGRHDVTFTDLMRLHQSQMKMSNRLNTNFEQTLKREENELKKAQNLEQLLRELVRGVNDLNNADGCGPLMTERKPSMQQRPDDSKMKADQPRSKKDDDKKAIGTKPKDSQKGDGKAKSATQQEGDFTKLSQEIDQAKAETFEIFRSMNQCLAQLNSRLNTAYKINEDAETSAEVGAVLDTVIFDVTNMFDESKQRFGDDANDMKRYMEELDKHVSHAEKMLAFLDRELVKLLAIGGRKEASKVDQKNYGQVIKFVAETFEALLKKLKDQNKEVHKMTNERNDIERENERRQKLHEQEMITKRAKLDDLKRQTESLNHQTELMRNEMRRAPRSPVASESEAKNKIQALKTLQQKVGGQQVGDLEKQLQAAKAKNDDAMKQLNKLTVEINELDGKLKDKRKELDELKQRGNRRKSDDYRKSDRLERQIGELTREIGRLEMELQRSRQQQQPQQQVPTPQPVQQFSSPIGHSNEDFDRLARTERKMNDRLKGLEDRLRQAETDRGDLLDQVRNLEDQYRNACDELNRGANRRRDVDGQQLQDVLDKIGNIERKLDREQEGGRQLDQDTRQQPTQKLDREQDGGRQLDQDKWQQQPTPVQPLQFEHTSVTRIGGGAGPQMEQSTSSVTPTSTFPCAPPASPSPIDRKPSPQGDRGASKQYPPFPIKRSTQRDAGRVRSRTSSTPPTGIDYDEQIRSLEASKHLAQSRLENLKKKFETTRSAPKSNRGGSISQSRHSSIQPSDSPEPSQTRSPGRNDKRSSDEQDKAPAKQIDQNDKRAENRPVESSQTKLTRLPQRSQKNRRPSGLQQQVEVRIFHKIQMEKRDSDGANPKLYDVKGDLVIAIEPSTTESSTPDANAGKESSSGATSSPCPPNTPGQSSEPQVQRPATRNENDQPRGQRSKKRSKSKRKETGGK